MPTLKEIENKIDGYLYLKDKDIIKLLAGFCLTCRLPKAVSPLWLFIAAGSSAGKTAMIELFEGVPGFTQVDNMTSNSLQSGMKRTDKSASLLENLPENGFIVFKDFTTMLSKNPEVLAEIMGQLRIMYDGSSVKVTGGQREKQEWRGKVSMLGAGTNVLYSKNEQFADMGQRMLIYNFEQADDYEISNFIYQHKKDNRGIKKEELQNMLKEYVLSIDVPTDPENLPEIDRQTWDDLTDIAHLASTARSPVTRNKYSRNQDITDRGMKEAFTRLFHQLLVQAYGLMLQNPDKCLAPEDKKLLFKLGLDCIDPKRKEVLKALTKFLLGGGAEEIGEVIKYPRASAEQYIEDLMVHGMVTKEKVRFSHGTKVIYKIVPKYRDIISKFEHIVPEEKSIPVEEVEPLPPEPPILTKEEQVAIDIFN